MNTLPMKAPELSVSEWLNTDAPITLSQLRGKVVVIEAFQMLCPGCVSHGLPQAQRISETFPKDEVIVLGLHAVFEHHDVQGSKKALEAFLHEYRIGFPVAIDAPSNNQPTPQTMAAYQLRGTPSLILIDREGNYQNQFFGEASDLALGAHIMRLIGRADQKKVSNGKTESPENMGEACDENGCAINIAGSAK